MNLRLSILLVAVLVIFGGTFLVVRLTGSDNVPLTRPWLYRMDDSSLANISVTYQGQTVEYSKKTGTFDWYIQGPGGTLVFQKLWGGTPLLLSGPRVSREVSEKLDDPANFGLEPPQTRVVVTDRSGNTIEFHLGDATPDTLNQYARLVGDEALFTVPISWGDVINRLATKPPFLRLFQVEEARVALIEVTHQAQTTAFRWDPEVEGWRFVGPETVLVSEEKWGDTAQLISGPRVDERVARDLEDPAQYGLEPPETRVIVGMPGVPPVEFHLGNITEDGQHRYARVSGEPELYSMPIEQAQRIIDLATNPPFATKTESVTPSSG